MIINWLGIIIITKKLKKMEWNKKMIKLEQWVLNSLQPIFQSKTHSLSFVTTLWTHQ